MRTFPIYPSRASEFRWLCGWIFLLPAIFPAFSYAVSVSCITPAWADGWVTARCGIFVDNEGYVNEIAFLDNYYNCTPRSEQRYFVGIGAQLIDVSSSVSGVCVLGCGGSGSCSANGSNCTAWCRCPPNSPAVGTVSGFGSCSFNYKIVLGNDTIPPNPDCAYTETAAQALLAAKQAECDSIGGVYSGEIIHRENGEWCVEGSCEPDACPDGSTGEGSFLQKKNVSEKSSEMFLPDEHAIDYRNKADYSRSKSNLFYDALGRRTEHRPEARRRLFEVKKDKTVTREIKPDVVLRKDSQKKCCVESFQISGAEMISNYQKVGIDIIITASFTNNDKCSASCCEFKQKAKAKALKNGTSDEFSTCGVRLDSGNFIEDCYGRDQVGRGFEVYNDNTGSYRMTDTPGLIGVVSGDILDMEMDFESYIHDICYCNIRESRIIRWGFKTEGIYPTITTTLKGEIQP